MALENLLSPFKLGDIAVKNRIAMAPLTRSRAGTSRVPNALMAEYYSQRASAGLVISEATAISDQSLGWTNTAAIYTDEQATAWKQVVSAVHEAGAPMILQLWHCGRASHSDFHEGHALPVAPSAIKLNGEYIHTPEGKKAYETPRALETSELPGIANDYKVAAQRAKDAGFDGIEIHSANGYLLDQFLQSKTNHRTDEYGGSIENRFRLLKEVVEAVLTVWPAAKVGVRLAPNGVYNDMGSPDYRETFLYVAEQLNTYHLAYLHIVDGLAFGFHELGKPVELAEFRKVFKGALIGNCGYTAESAETAIATGVADMIAFGRPYLSNPDLVERFANGWPLNAEAPMKDWYSFNAEGYVDFPFYKATADSTK
jgi:N-ethylmaleimide reductase